MHRYVLVLDFGSQYTQLIARRVRELGVFSVIKPCTTKFSEVDTSIVSAVILSGGPSSVVSDDAPVFDKAWLHCGLPILGVCYGMQLIAHEFGAVLSQGASREYGHAELEVLENSSLFAGFDRTELTTVWMSHGDHVDSCPDDFKLLARSVGAPIAAIEHINEKIFGIQFHPEVMHTARGREILENFVLTQAGCSRDWTAANFIETSLQEINSQVDANANVICGLSGGVDSTVAAVLVSKALGSRLHCIFVDNGLLRSHEAQRVMEMVGSNGLGLNVHLVDASTEFHNALKGIVDPEEKRKTIGKLFIDVFDREAQRIKNVTHLVQGTLYPDVIESVSVGGPSAVIKSHHNVGGLPDRMMLKLIEPFRELFKDEVRKLGQELRVPAELISRQPFPGPGLAVRILGDVTPERLEVLRQADRIFLEEVRAEGLYEQVWQSFAVLLPIQSVGVMGDGRTYEQTVVLRAVESQDGMTADWCYFPKELLRRASNRIINEVKGVNRVVLDISSKPPATIEWE